MIAALLISGLGETPTSSSSTAGKGMQELLFRLRDILGVNAERFGFNDFTLAKNFIRQEKPDRVVFIPHSFGIKVAIELCEWAAGLLFVGDDPFDSYLYAIDPVMNFPAIWPVSWFQRMRQKHFDIPMNVEKAICILRDPPGGVPYSRPFRPATNVLNGSCSGSHNQIIEALHGDIVAFVRSLL